MSLVYDSSQIEALSRKKKKEMQTPTLVKIDLLKLITKDEDHAFKGNNICNSLQFIHCHYLISPLTMRVAYKDASYLIISYMLLWSVAGLQNQERAFSSRNSEDLILNGQLADDSPLTKQQPPSSSCVVLFLLCLYTLLISLGAILNFQ